jgi:hypothetical protein
LAFLVRNSAIILVDLFDGGLFKFTLPDNINVFCLVSLPAHDIISLYFPLINAQNQLMYLTLLHRSQEWHPLQELNQGFLLSLLCLAQDVSEVLLREHSERAVIYTMNGGLARLIVRKGKFAEVATRSQVRNRSQQLCKLFVVKLG